MPETTSEFSIADQLILNTIVQRGMAEQRVPGVIAGVWVGDAGWTTAQGIADLRTAEPMMRDGHIRIASVSKTFVATVLLQLIAEGKVTLEDVLEQYVPGVPNGNRITLRHLLGMTGGIFNFINDPEFEPAYTNDPLIPFSREFFLELLRRNPPRFAPGEGVEYSDSNYFLLGMIIEALTGRKRDRWLVRTVGLLAAVIGLTLVRRPSQSGELADVSAGAFALADVLAVSAGQMPTYLADAGVEAAFAAARRVSSAQLQRPLA